MSKPARKRDNLYYLDRMRDEHPGIYTDYKAGKFKNVAAALQAAGLRKPQDVLVVLKSAWNRANATEKYAFKLLIGCVAPAPATATPRTKAPAALAAPPVPLPSSTNGNMGRKVSILQTKRELSSVLAGAVRQIMDHRKLKIGQIMREMGMNARDASLGMALLRNTQVRDDLVKALEVWVQKNSRS